MQSSFYDIFGPERRDLASIQTVKHSSGSHALKGVETENLKVKSISVPDGHVGKKALADIGNKQKQNKLLQEKAKVFLSTNDQENALSNLVTRTPLQKAKTCSQTPNLVTRTPLQKAKICSQTPNLITKTPVQKSKMSMQTPSLKPVVRSPLSDIFPKQTALIPDFQQPSQREKEKSFKATEIEDFTIGNLDNLSVWENDKIFHEDDYADILPKSSLRSEKEIYKLVNFWEMSKEPFDFESDEDVPVKDKPGNLFTPAALFDVCMEEPFSIPIFSDDDF